MPTQTQAIVISTTEDSSLISATIRTCSATDAITTTNDTTASLQINKEPEISSTTSVLGRLGSPIYFYTRTNDAAVYFYTRTNNNPVYFYAGDAGIDRFIWKRITMWTDNNRNKENKEEAVNISESSQEVTIDKTEEQTESVTTDYDYTVA